MVSKTYFEPKGGHSGFSRPWQYLVAFKDFDTRSDWFSNSALVSKKIRERTLPTIDGSSPFLYFDGPTMLTYQYPSKQSEVVFCRGNPHVKECKEGHGFNPERQNLPLSSLEVKQSSLGERAGRGVFAKVDIPSQSYVGLEKLIPIIYGSPQTYNLMANWEYYNETIYDFYRGDELEVYTHGYGHVFSHHVSFQWDNFPAPSLFLHQTVLTYSIVYSLNMIYVLCLVRGGTMYTSIQRCVVGSFCTRICRSVII